VKEPKKHTSDFDDETEEEFCVRCEEPWPCARVRKWEKSKSCRIAKLEEELKRTRENVKILGDAIDDTVEMQRRQRLLINAVLMWLRDLGGDNRISVMISSNPIEVTSILMNSCSSFEKGPEEFNVTYKSAAGKTYVNGKLTEERSVRSNG